MYGLLLESVADCVKEKWGETVWASLVEQAGIGWGGFSIHKVYSDVHMERVAQTLSKILFMSEDEIMFKFGAHFMTFVAGYGYDQVTKVLGRKLCDFINGLDNLHDYISNLYKEIRPPSFYVEKEDDKGLTFHYHTPRKYLPFVHYVRGMITTAARIYYKMADFSVAVTKEELLDGGMHAIYRVTYTNNSLGVQGPWMPVLRKLREETPLTVHSDVLFNSFPFSIIFSESMEVLSCGAGVVKSFPTLVGKKITDFFVLTKPFGISFTWDFMRNRPLNVLVEMTSTVALWTEYEEYLRSQEILDPENAPPPPNRTDSPPLKLRGTTAYLKSWNSVIFMCTPVFESLDTMNDIGLYISDLSFQDSVQVLLVAGPQQSAELKIALDMEQAKNSKLEETLGKLDTENKKTDALLFSMIPREIAERLKKGESPINIAETFPDVTVLFSDVVGFTNICSRITPMEVVAILNQIYTVFDTLSERYEVFKVETIGDGYMAVSGAPVRTKMHAQHICDMALEMQAGIRHLKDPWTGSPIRIRIGIHSGGVVAGVVGQKMIRYCLFGDTVNTASRMESCGEGCEIHISKTVRDRLVVTGAYKIEDRGMIYIKGKGQMRTYWLKGKTIKTNNSTGQSFMEDLVSQTTGVSPMDQKKALKILHPVLDISNVDSKKSESSAVKHTKQPNCDRPLHTQMMVSSEQGSGKPDDYKSEKSMSFRQALEEIVDIQTKEIAAYQEGHSVGQYNYDQSKTSGESRMLLSIREAEGEATGMIPFEEEKLQYDYHCKNDINPPELIGPQHGGKTFLQITEGNRGLKDNLNVIASTIQQSQMNLDALPAETKGRQTNFMHTDEKLNHTSATQVPNNFFPDSTGDKSNRGGLDVVENINSASRRNIQGNQCMPDNTAIDILATMSSKSKTESSPELTRSPIAIRLGEIYGKPKVSDNIKSPRPRAPATTLQLMNEEEICKSVTIQPAPPSKTGPDKTNKMNGVRKIGGKVEKSTIKNDSGSDELPDPPRSIGALNILATKYQNNQKRDGRKAYISPSKAEYRVSDEHLKNEHAVRQSPCIRSDPSANYHLEQASFNRRTAGKSTSRPRRKNVAPEAITVIRRKKSISLSEDVRQEDSPMRQRKTKSANMERHSAVCVIC
uniref:soluble guanylate cyclase 88E-like n=1 Tax=Styela clava TaxID=7725 RepID=UPI00193ACF0C|nr:soluble guanylate cyclase 88E-like [Styela clava]